MDADAPRLLIIDDEPNIRSGLSKGLLSVTSLIDTAATGEEGLRKFEERAHEIVITDLRLPGALVQPIAAEDVATAVARTAAGDPVNGDREIAGPEQFGMDEWARRALTFRKDPRTVVRDDTAPYYGARIEERTLVPVDGAWIFETTLEEWLPANPPRG